MIDLTKYAPVQAIGYPGFYVIPSIENYVTDEYGKILNIKTGKLISNTSDKVGYLINRLIISV